MELTPPGHAAAPIDASPPVLGWPREPRHLAAGRGSSWWGEGWTIFTAAPLPWVAMLVALFVINVVLAWIPVVGSLATTVLGPVFAGGLLLGCHGLARGRPLEFGDLFRAFQSDRLVPLAILGAIALGFFVLLFLVYMLLFAGAMGTAMMSGIMTGGSVGNLGTGAMAGLGVAAVVGGLVGLVAAVLFAMAWWFAPALVALNRAPPLDAMKASFEASLSNLGAMTVFGLIFIGLAIVASIPMALGWLVLAPVLVGAGYASWREVFGD